MLDVNVNYTGTGDGYLDYPYYTGFSPVPLADTAGFERGRSDSSVPQVQSSLLTGESYHDCQYSTTEQNYSFDPYDGGRSEFLDPRVVRRPYGEASRTHLDFGIAQTTPIVSDEAVVSEPTNPLLFSPAAGTVGNEGATQVPTELPPVGVSNLGTQHSSKRKRSASPDCRDEGKRAQRKKRRHPAAREWAQVSLAGIVLTQKGTLTTVVLDFPDHYTLAHAPRFPHGGTDCVPIAKCAESLATPALEWFHGRGGREKARRDQSPRCIEPPLLSSRWP